MKKFLSFVLAMTMVMALAACGGSKAPAESNTAPANTESSAPAENTGAAFTTANAGVLTMATNATFEPYEYIQNGEVIGLDVDFAKAICDKLGFSSLEFQTLEGVEESIGLDPCKLCTYCWSGKE